MVRLADVWLGFGFLAHMLVDYIKSWVPFLHLIVEEDGTPQYRMLDSSDVYKWDLNKLLLTLGILTFLFPEIAIMNGVIYVIAIPLYSVRYQFNALAARAGIE